MIFEALTSGQSSNNLPNMNNLIPASSPVRGPQVDGVEGVWPAAVDCRAVVSDDVVVAAGCSRGRPSLPSCAPSAPAAPV